MKITACPKCGSKKIGMGTMNAGVIFGITSWKSVCKECGYQGEPLIFDSEKEYGKFIQGLRQEPESDCDIQDESCQLSPKDKQVMSLLEEEISNVASAQDEQGNQGVFSKNKSWIIEIIVAVILAAGTVMFYFSRLPFGDPGIIIIYSVFLFIVLTAGILFGIVVIEYAFLSVRRNLGGKK